MILVWKERYLYQNSRNLGDIRWHEMRSSEDMTFNIFLQSSISVYRCHDDYVLKRCLKIQIYLNKFVFMTMTLNKVLITYLFRKSILDNILMIFVCLQSTTIIKWIYQKLFVISIALVIFPHIIVKYLMLYWNAF